MKNVSLNVGRYFVSEFMDFFIMVRLDLDREDRDSVDKHHKVSTFAVEFEAADMDFVYNQNSAEFEWFFSYLEVADS